MVHQAKTPSNSTHIGAYKKREEKIKKQRQQTNEQTKYSQTKRDGSPGQDTI